VVHDPRQLVTSAAFSSDGQYVVTAQQDGTVCVWNWRRPPALWCKQVDRQPVENALFSPNGKLIIAATSDGKVRVWDPGRRTLLHTLISHISRYHRLTRVAVSDDSQYIATVGADDVLHVWNAQNGQLLRKLPGHTKSVNSIAFSADSRYIVTASDD
jgi:WD40 repeat protein